MKKILVTGGAGYIGSHLCEELLKKNFQVFSLDNYSSGSEGNHIVGVKYLKGDTKDIEELLKAENNFIPDMIFHLGEYSRTSASFLDPAKTWELNTHGTFKVLEYCRKNKVRILYAGSSTKMADGGDGRNQSPYAWTKATNTELVQRYGEWFGLDYCITYFYNVFGGREIGVGPYATLIAIWKDKIKKGEKLGVVSPGSQMRSFTHVSDIVRGLILAGEKGKGDGYALGPKEMFTLLDVAKIFTKGDMNKIVMLPELPGDRKTVSIDLSKTEEELGWQAEIKLKEHLEDFIKSVNS